MEILQEYLTVSGIMTKCIYGSQSVYLIYNLRSRELNREILEKISHLIDELKFAHQYDVHVVNRRSCPVSDNMLLAHLDSYEYSAVIWHKAA